MTSVVRERGRRVRTLVVASTLAIVAGPYALGRGGTGSGRALVASTISSSVGRVSPPDPSPSAWRQPFERSVREGNDRSLGLIEDALSQAEQRAGADPAYVAELERMRAALKRPLSQYSSTQR